MNYDYLERFREERKALKISQRKIGEYVNHCNAEISLKENGKKDFTAYELHRIYKKFGIEAGFLEVYRAIDTGKTEKLLKKNIDNRITNFSMDELRGIEEKDYKKITVYTLEKIKKVIECKIKYVVKDEDIEFIKLKPNEKKELKKLMELYYKKDGNIKRALELLKVAIRP